MELAEWSNKRISCVRATNPAGQAGQVVAIVALAFFVLVGSVALATDGSQAYAQRRLAQKAADACAMAGMRAHLRGGDEAAVETAIHKYAQLNGLDPSYPGSVLWSYVGEGEEDVGVAVTTTLTFRTAFAGVFGFDTLDIGASAQAGVMYEYLPGTPAFSWALFANNSSDPQAITLDGNSTIVEAGTLVMGSVHSNGGIYITGNNNVIQGGTESVGPFFLDGNNNVIDSPFEVTESGGCTIQGNNDYATPTNTANWEEMPQWNLTDYGPNRPSWVPESDWHYYDSDLVIDVSNQTLTGVYYVEGNLTFNANYLVGQATFVATGSILATGEHYEFMPYDGEVLMFANGGDLQIGIQNSNNMELGGVLYAPHGQAGVDGNALSTPLAGSIIADTIEIVGNATCIAAYSTVYFESGTTIMSVVLVQ
jgi:hypothetical protein